MEIIISKLLESLNIKQMGYLELLDYSLKLTILGSFLVIPFVVFAVLTAWFKKKLHLK